MSTITTSDGTDIYYKDWGEGPAMTLSHGWPRRENRRVDARGRLREAHDLFHAMGAMGAYAVMPPSIHR